MPARAHALAARTCLQRQCAGHARPTCGASSSTMERSNGAWALKRDNAAGLVVRSLALEHGTDWLATAITVADIPVADIAAPTQ